MIFLFILTNLVIGVDSDMRIQRARLSELFLADSTLVGLFSCK